jgi:serine/threonine-protein kinase
VPVLEDLSATVAFGSAQLDFSNTGTVLYRSGQTFGRLRNVVQWLKGDGTTESLWAEPANYRDPRVSPDGSRLAIVVSEGPNSDIWVYDWQGGRKIKLSAGSGVSGFPTWSPDGQYVVFHSAGQLFSARADSAEPPQPLTTSTSSRLPSSFTPDGRHLLFYELKAGGGSLIQSLPVKSESGMLRSGEPQLLRESSASIPVPAVSPDGRWVAYASSESGAYEVYVRAFPDDGRQWPISTGGGSFPTWSRTGNELFYRTEDQFLMVAGYTLAGGSFVAGKPRLWSKTRLFDTGLTQNFDLAPDGQRFAVVMPADGQESGATQLQMMLVLNFFDEVRRRVAAARSASP